MVWLEIAHRCGYLSTPIRARLEEGYEVLIAQLVRTMQHPEQCAPLK